jgi:GNAT superfamily N-acetyltransferase
VLELRDVTTDRIADVRARTVERVAARRVRMRFLEPERARREAEELVEHTADTSVWLEAVVDGDVVGDVWLNPEGEELVVSDVVLEDSARAGDLLEAIVTRARSEGARMIGIDTEPGETTGAAIAARPGFRLRATNMVLPLERPIADPAPLVLSPMSGPDFEVFMGGEVEGFAQELASAGMDIERARERSRTLMGELLPSGIDSPGMEFHTAKVGEDVVGDLWLSVGETMAFVYNIVVRPEHRRRGYGAGIMNAAALRSRELGHPVLGLNVFAHNPSARALYDKLGYEVAHDYLTFDVPDAD